MARQKSCKRREAQATAPKPRSTLHEILATRKGGRHKPGSQKRVGQKLRRELDEE